MRTGFELLAAVAVVSGCAKSVTDPLPSIPIDDGFAVGGAKWDSGRTTLLVAKVYEHAGKTAVCGASATSGGRGQKYRFDDLMIASTSVRVNDETLIRDLSFFPKVAFREGDYPAGEAACRLTSRPWQPEYADSVALHRSKSRYKIYD